MDLDLSPFLRPTPPFADLEEAGAKRPAQFRV